MNKPKLMIIGAGPAGLSAAIYGCRYGMEVTVFEAFAPGGQLNTTPQIDNYPGIMEIDGFSLSDAMKKQAVSLGATIASKQVTELLLSERIVKTKETEYKADAVVIATGAKRRKLSVPGEDELFGKGVSYCATCDGAFYKNKDVAIVGGGNTALEDALFLAGICSTVYLIHRRDEFRGMKSLESAVRANEKIKLCLSSTVNEIKGDKKVSSIVISDSNNTDGINSDSKTTELSVNGVFVAIGTEPESELFINQIPLDKSGYIIASEDCQTMLPGVFAAGDCRKKPLRQIVTAAADGANAAFHAALHCNI